MERLTEQLLEILEREPDELRGEIIKGFIAQVRQQQIQAVINKMKFAAENFGNEDQRKAIAELSKE